VQEEVKTNTKMRDMRFSQRCCWRFKPYGMLRHVYWLNRCSEGHLQGQAVHSSWTASLWRWTHYNSSKRRGIYQSTWCNILEDVSLLMCSRTYWYRCIIRHSLRNKKGKPYTRLPPVCLLVSWYQRPKHLVGFSWNSAGEFFQQNV